MARVATRYRGCGCGWTADRRATAGAARIVRPAARRRAAGGTSAVARHSLGGGVFGRNSHSGSIAQCQHSGLRALHT